MLDELRTSDMKGTVLLLCVSLNPFLSEVLIHFSVHKRSSKVVVEYVGLFQAQYIIAYSSER